MLSLIISKEELNNIKNNVNTIIIDIRDKNEFERSHIEGAINYSDDLLTKTNFEDNIITKDKQIILYCERGGRSIYVARKLRARGYNAASLLGGLENFMS